jgi:regulator of sigma D
LTLDAREECADIANFCMFISDNISYGHFKMEDN